MKISSRALGAVLLGLSLCGGLVTSAHAAPAKGMTKGAVKSAAKPVVNGKKPQMQRMFDAVGVTPDQKKKLLAISKAQRTQVKAIQADAKLSEADKKTKVKAARKVGNQKGVALLSADQKVKLKAFQKQMAAERKAAAAKKGKM